MWEVNVKGGGPGELFEISVLRSDNDIGKRSYGWFDRNKLLISSSGGPCRNHIARESIWQRLLKVAEETAAEMNAESES